MAALYQHANRIVDAELARLNARLPNLDSWVRRDGDQTVYHMVDVVLRSPTERFIRLGRSGIITDRALIGANGRDNHEAAVGLGLLVDEPRPVRW